MEFRVRLESKVHSYSPNHGMYLSFWRRHGLYLTCLPNPAFGIVLLGVGYMDMDMDVWIYGYMDIWIYGYMDVRIYGYMDIWSHVWSFLSRTYTELPIGSHSVHMQWPVSRRGGSSGVQGAIGIKGAQLLT